MVTERFVPSFDGTRLFTSQRGAGPDLLLVDGLGCDGFIWKYLEPALARRYRVLRLHHRGHGQSELPRSANATTVDDLVGDVIAVLDAYQAEQPILLGHSMGVQLILELALQHPGRVRALVPICGSYGRPLTTLHDRDVANALFPHLYRLARRFPRAAQRIWGAMLQSELSYWVALMTEVNPQLVRREDLLPYFQHLVGMDVRVFLRVLDAINAHTTEDRLHLLRHPTYIVAGEGDRFTPAWLSVRMHRLIEGSELLMVADGTHTAPIERPQLILEHLDPFLQRHAAPARAPGAAEAAAPRKRARTRTRRPKVSAPA